MIVPRPEPSAIVAFPGLESVTPKVSSISSSTSPFTVTVNVVVVEPAETVLLPLAATKSVPAVAEPAAVAQSNVTAWPLAADSVTVNVAVVVPAFPSVTETSLTEREGAASSSVIVPRPEPSAIVAFPGLESVMPYVSLASSTVSPFTVTVNVAVVEPAAMVSAAARGDVVRAGALRSRGRWSSRTSRGSHSPTTA